MDAFHADRRRKDGVAPYCKPCRSHTAQERYKRLDPVKQKRYANDYYMRNRDRLLAKQKAYTETLTPEERRLRARRARLKMSYGISLEQYDELVAAQNNQCAICAKEGTDEELLAIDHCHDSLEIRGLLCRTCNAGIGLLGDTIEGLERALAYLKDCGE